MAACNSTIKATHIMCNCPSTAVNPLKLKINEIKLSNNVNKDLEFVELKSVVFEATSKLNGYFIFDVVMSATNGQCNDRKTNISSVTDISFAYDLKGRELDERGLFVFGGKGYTRLWSTKGKAFGYPERLDRGCGISFAFDVDIFTPTMANITHGFFLVYLHARPV